MRIISGKEKANWHSNRDSCAQSISNFRPSCLELDQKVAHLDLNCLFFFFLGKFQRSIPDVIEQNTCAAAVWAELLTCLRLRNWGEAVCVSV